MLELNPVSLDRAAPFLGDGEAVGTVTAAIGDLLLLLPIEGDGDIQ